MNYIQKIKAIGKSEVCSDEDLLLFLPDYPVLRGSEFIFSIGWANSKKYIDGEIDYFVKGLHLIEEKYKAKAENDFGFGSPSPSYKIVQSFAEQDFNKALELEKWIALNGGNYYVGKVSKPEEFNSRIQTKSMIKLGNEIRQREKQARKFAKIEARKIISDKKIEIHNKKVQVDRIERDKIAQLPVEQLLNRIVEDGSRPIYFYEDELLKIEKNQLTEKCKINISKLIDKNKDNRKTRKIINHLMTLNS